MSALLRDIQAGKWGTKAFQEGIFISVLAAGSVYSHPKAEPQEQKGFALYTLASRLQKKEAKFNPYMIVCISVGYFTLSAM
jgi:hypothetical protein